MISEADREIWDRWTASQRRLAAAADARRCVRVVDELIALLEERHLDGERTYDRVLRQRVRRMALEIGAEMPRSVERARNTVRLHAALLDWQEALLDAVMPARLEYADVHDSNWKSPELEGW